MEWLGNESYQACHTFEGSCAGTAWCHQCLRGILSRQHRQDTLPHRPVQEVGLALRKLEVSCQVASLSQSHLLALRDHLEQQANPPPSKITWLNYAAHRILGRSMHHCSHLSQVSHLLFVRLHGGYDPPQAAACWWPAPWRGWMYSDFHRVGFNPSMVAPVPSSGSQMDLTALHSLALNLSLIFWHRTKFGSYQLSLLHLSWQYMRPKKQADAYHPIGLEFGSDLYLPLANDLSHGDHL